MLGLVALAAVLFFTGIGGGSLILLLWLVGCAAMMFFMMRGTGSGDGHHGGQNATHDDHSDTPSFTKRHP